MLYRVINLKKTRKKRRKVLTKGRGFDIITELSTRVEGRNEL